MGWLCDRWIPPPHGERRDRIRESSMRRNISVPSTLTSLALSIALAPTLGLFLSAPTAAQSTDLPVRPAAQSSDHAVVYLDQAWSQADREWYYHFSQGSAVMSYDIFLNLELADSQELVRSDANSERFGLIPEAANPQYNPDGLPIGASKTVIATPRWKGEETGEFAGMTCAACHEEELEYKGKHIRIDGGVGNKFDMQGYIEALDNAMQATLTDSAKFDRLAARLAASNSDAKEKLRERFERQAAYVHEYRGR